VRKHKDRIWGWRTRRGRRVWRSSSRLSNRRGIVAAPPPVEVVGADAKVAAGQPDVASMGQVELHIPQTLSGLTGQRRRGAEPSPPQWKLGNGHGPSIAMAKGRMKGNPTRHPSLRYSRIHLNLYRAPRTGAIVDAEHVAAPRASARDHG
jgi:hypothetical protein